VWLPLWRVVLITRNGLRLQNPRDSDDEEEVPMSMSIASVGRTEVGKVVVVRSESGVVRK
jgi:hypothetical protein